MTDETWGAIREQLRKTIGTSSYSNWIRPLTFVGLDERVARFEAPNTFLADWVRRNFGEQILRLMRKEGLLVDRLAIRSAAGKACAAKPAKGENGEKGEKGTKGEAGANGAKTAAGAPGAGGAAPAGGLPAAPLDPRFTFESFVVGRPNEVAHAAARKVADEGEVDFNPLFLHGGVGLGKTHLMHAIAWQLRRKQPQLRVVYLSADMFMYTFIQALRERRIMDFKHQFRTADVLMVDDVQFIAGKNSTQDEFFHTFNALIDQRKQIILSADRTPGDIENLDERISSRLQHGLVVDLHPADYELRLGVLQKKLEQHRERNPAFALEDGVLEFLAARITSNIRTVEGALNRLIVYASLLSRNEITLELAQECLSDLLRTAGRRITIDAIQRKVAEHYELRLSDLLGPRRTRSIARPRQMAMYLAKRLTNRSLPEIGRHFGRRDHTTVMHGVRRIEELIKTDSQLADDYELLRRALEG